MKRIYYGWFIVAVAVGANALVNGATYSAFGLFVLPVSAEYNLSRADMNTGMILLNIGMALISPVLGRMLDFLPAKRIMMGGALLFGACFVTLALSRSLWLSAAILTLPMAAGMLASAALTMSVLVARWFVAQRGRAMALSILGVSLGSIVVAPVISILIESYGWRTTLLVIAAAETALLLVLALAVRDRPGEGDVEGGKQTSAASAAAKPPAKVGAVLRMPQFWTISLSVGLAGAVAQTLVISLIPLARGDGLTAVQATSLISITGAAAICSKLLLAVVADKIDRIALLTGLCTLGVILNTALLFSHDYPVLIGCAIGLGLTGGAMSALTFALLADRFGAASFGTVRGLLAPIPAVLSAVAIRSAGEIFDRTGSYNVMFATFIVLEGLAAVLMISTRFTKRMD